MKLQQLREDPHQIIQCNGLTLYGRELLTNQAQTKTPNTLSNLALNGIALTLVVDELLLRGGHQHRIVLRPSQTRAA